jgi:hypothetical protein
VKSIEALITLTEKLSDSKEDDRCSCGCLYNFRTELIRDRNLKMRVKECLNDSCKNYKILTILGPDEG